MMKRLLLSGAALSMMAGLAMAQAPADPVQNTNPPAPVSPHAIAPQNAPADAAADNATQNQESPNLYSNLQGADLVDGQDKSLGRVADVILDSSGQLRQIVVGHGGLLGIGETLRAVDAAELPQVQDGKVRMPDMTTASLESLPQYNYPEAETGRASTSGSAAPATTEAPAAANAPAGTVATGGNQPGSTTDLNANSSAAPASGEAANTAAASSDMASGAAVSGSDMWPASYLVGAKITNAQESAAINDLRFEGNKVAAALVDKGSLGLGSDVSEVPFTNLALAGSPKSPKITLKSGTPNIAVEGQAPAANQ
ncbi:PRC-barrel domain-containing protein [Terrihabitans rhizophilus]|uniref:PRC-barrel domain-containing protein n=1 Tax=Terrihabitans rhizophilus TaxID=3092662 RepID=A0ABU4RRV1_9HYPH|nr:PRC-barrel domain-containing protein [Terrihabitans sp. PJ23]MDX6807574.1 PRC-barrel domain-containing protein [Terrihabitans sp. PJ23]